VHFLGILANRVIASSKDTKYIQVYIKQCNIANAESKMV